MIVSLGPGRGGDRGDGLGVLWGFEDGGVRGAGVELRGGQWPGVRSRPGWKCTVNLAVSATRTGSVGMSSLGAEKWSLVSMFWQVVFCDSANR